MSTSDPPSNPPPDPLASAPWGSAPRPGLLIVHVAPPEAPDGAGAVYRTQQPCRALGEIPEVTVVSGSTLSPELFELGLLLDADVLILRDALDPDLVPLIAARRRLGRLSIFELSGHPYASPVPSVGPLAALPELLRRSQRPLLARQADGMQLAAAALDAQFPHLNPRRATFPSQLWEMPPPRPVGDRRRDQVTIGWGGPRAEREDLRQALPALAATLERHPEVRLAVMGDPKVGSLLDGLPADRRTFTPWTTRAAYLHFLDGIDIGLAPLVSTAANRVAGDERFIEYAARGVVTVAADLEPYRAVVRPGETGYLFREAGDLEGALEQALADGGARAAVAESAARHVASERLERRHAARRLGFYLSVAAQLGMELGVRPDGGAPAPGRRTAALPDALLDPRSAARTFEGSRYVALGAGEVETLLSEGQSLQRAGNVEEARRRFTEAARLAPRSHLPALLLGTLDATAASVEALARAEELNPASFQAPYLRGARLLERGDTDGAAQAFERARAVAPVHGAAQERLAALAEAAGRVDEARLLYEEAAIHNGAFAQPIARLATLAQQDGKIDRAVGLLERSLVEDPELPLTNFLVGGAYLEQKRFHQARLHLRRALTGTEDRASILTQLAKAEAGLGNAEAARMTMEEADSLTPPPDTAAR